MAIKIAAWNVEGRLHGYKKAGRGTAAQILEGIEALDVDVLVLPEFYMNSLANGVEDRLRTLGYEFFETAYGDLNRSEDERQKWGAMHIGVLSRLPVSNVEIIRPGDVRNLLTCQVKDPEIGRKLRVIATHLDDRTEAARIRQVKDLVESINKTNMPTVMLGDFNAMWRTKRARLLNSRPVRSLAKRIPHEILRWTAVRAVEMAEGSTLSWLVAHTNLRDSDERRRPTTTAKRRETPYLPSIRLIQIDHMFVSPEVVVENFTIGKDAGSDHRSISATLVVTE